MIIEMYVKHCFNAVYGWFIRFMVIYVQYLKCIENYSYYGRRLYSCLRDGSDGSQWEQIT